MDRTPAKPAFERDPIDARGAPDPLDGLDGGRWLRPRWNPWPADASDAAARARLVRGFFDALPRRTLVKRNPRRSVWRMEGDAGGGAFYVKQFHAAGAFESLVYRLGWGSASREWRTLVPLAEWARTADHPVAVCPEPVMLGLGDSGRAWLVTREVASAAPLGDWFAGPFRSLTEPQRAAALHGLGRALADVLSAFESAGVATYDMHPGNFLLQTADPDHPRLVYVDLGQTTTRRYWPGAAGAAPGGLRRALVCMNHPLRPVLSATDRLRVWLGFDAEIDKAEIRDIEADTDEFDRLFYLRRDKRCDGAGRYFARLKRGRFRGNALLVLKTTADVGSGVTRRIEAEAWKAALADPESFRTSGRTLKESKSVRVSAVDLPGIGAAVCKWPRRHKRVNWLLDAFRPSRARRGWRLGHALVLRGLPTPVPLAVMERRVAGYPLEAFLLTEYVPDSLPLDEFAPELAAMPEPRRTATRRNLAWDIARLLRRLHEAGFLHRDFKGANVLVRRDSTPGGTRPALFLIDMDGIALRRRVGDSQRHRALARLGESSLNWPGVSRTDRARVLWAYLCDLGGPRPAWKPLWRSLAPAVAEKAAGRKRA